MTHFDTVRAALEAWREISESYVRPSARLAAMNAAAVSALAALETEVAQLRAQLAEYESAPTVAKTLGNDHMHVNRDVARRLLIGTELVQRQQVTK